jgi:hypothetical protein
MKKNSAIFISNNRVFISTPSGKFVDVKPHVTESTRSRINQMIYDGKVRMILCSFGMWAVNRKNE